MPLPKPQAEFVEKLSREELLEFLDALQKNWWNLQNNWMAYMNNEYSMEEAVKGDGTVFPANARVQMFRLKKMFNLGGDVESLMKANALSTIWANGEYEIIPIDDKKFRIRVTDCFQQVRRVKEGMGELACKEAGMKICVDAMEVLNPTCKTTCLVCPPGEHPPDVWCEWEFEIE